ncbi:hypothetical protein [Methylorubrum sp. SB2]|uniref:hypothetical protein n=1 Tax=Methylorubrum subtropicum TaxID=3138812 RepID=UPI00313D5425
MIEDELTDNLKVGAFYWVLPVLDPDTEETWWNDCMPARYAGNGQWWYLDHEGVSDWPVRWVGPEIVKP